jgi:hypothetical protein
VTALMDSSWRMPPRPLSPDAQARLDDLVGQVATLWPYLNAVERYDWAKRVTACMGIQPEGTWYTFGLPVIVERFERTSP